jgi:hypothetical protein
VRPQRFDIAQEFAPGDGKQAAAAQSQAERGFSDQIDLLKKVDLKKHWLI